MKLLVILIGDDGKELGRTEIPLSNPPEPPPPDTTPPTVHIVEPAEGAVLSGEVSVIVEASEPSKITLIVDEEDYAWTTTEKTRWAFFFNADAFPHGSSHQLFATAVGAGGVGVSTSITVTIADTTPDPDVPWEQPDVIHVAHDKIPNLTARPTILSRRSGNWSDGNTL